MRNRGTDKIGNSFNAQLVAAVWNRATAVPGVDPGRLRLDSCGAWIEYAQYGNLTPSGTGWEIDHIKPVAGGGGDELENLQALQWENNRHKSDTWPGWSCLMSAKSRS